MSNQVIWEEFLNLMKAEAGNQVVETWFKAVVLEKWDSATSRVYLKAPNQFVCTWITQHYQALLVRHLGRLLHCTNPVIVLEVSQHATPDNARNIIPASVASHSSQKQPPHTPSYNPPSTQVKNNSTAVRAPQQHNTTAVSITTPDKRYRSGQNRINGLNDQYLFKNFVVGPSNSLAHAAAYAVCENLGKVYNPLFFYGGTGLGKTHLLQAIGNEVRSRYPHLNIKYETVDHFINEFINSIRFDRSSQFRNKYQKVDLLLIDDVQFLSHKEQTQEAFFHIFNILYEQQKQIVFSSDTFPKDIHGLQDRLKSRMEWGLVADIQMPDLETKIAILKKKAELHNINLPDDVADYIASRVCSSVRELEGAFVRASALSNLHNQPLTLELARRVLVAPSPKKRDGVPLDTVVRAVAKHYQSTTQEIKSKKRHKDVALTRQVAFYLMKKLTPYSLQVIGSFVGGRDHSTVIHAIARVEQMLNTDMSFGQDVKSIEDNILSGGE